jgi:hypothetical protein
MQTECDEWVMIRTPGSTSANTPGGDELEIPTDESVCSMGSISRITSIYSVDTDDTHDIVFQTLLFHFLREVGRLNEENEFLRQELDKRVHMSEVDVLEGFAKAMGVVMNVLAHSSNAPCTYPVTHRGPTCVFFRHPILPELGNVASEGRLQIGLFVGAQYSPDRVALALERRARERQSWTRVF